MNTGPLVEREALAGLVERVTFHNADNGFCVLRVKVRGQRDLVTVIGAAAVVSAGEFIQASGIWLNDRTHGLQFKAAFLKTAPPTTLEGIERYLGSGMIKGIGPIYASKLVQTFGVERVRRHRAGAGTSPGDRRRRTQALLADSRRLGRSEGDPRDHAVSA